MQNNNSQAPSPGGSHFARPSRPTNQEVSNLQELSQSVLHTPSMLSNFNRKRGFLANVNHMMRAAPTFNPDRSNAPLQMGAKDQMSSTGLLNGQLAGNEASSLNTQVLWGTNINAQDVQIKLKNFINTFMESNDDDEDDEEQYTRAPHYITKLNEMRELESPILEVDCDHLFQYDQQLYRQMEVYPADIIPIFDLVVTQVYKELFVYNMQEQEMVDQDDEGINDMIISVRPFNLRQVYRIREMEPAHIDRLVTLRGIIIRNSDVVPEMKEAFFVCDVCQREVQVFVERGKVSEPTICDGCKSQKSFVLVHNQCLFSDKQHVKVQETPESVPEGETPQTIHMCAYDDLVDYVRPGDRVEITGIYKAQGVRVNANKRTLKNVFRTYIDVMCYIKKDKSRFGMADPTVGEKAQNEEMQDEELEAEKHGAQEDAALQEDHVQYSEQEIRRFKEFSQRDDVYDILVDSIAPSIWENNDVKKGILCQLFGGVSKTFSQSGRGRFRGEINILLCGDPSTAKSQLLQYVHKIAPRGIYTSGKGSSAVGLTVYITKDPETKEVVLESGALVLSDRGICCIDEFDKMDDTTRVILHEAMEQQTVSVAKAGIIATLNARTAILAAANPVKSKYDPALSVVENIRLPPTLLSRFDLIYLILDKQSEPTDRRLANHIVSLYSVCASADGLTRKTENATSLIATNTMPKDFLARYISYARQTCTPSIPDHLVMFLVAEYGKMRSMGNSKKTITATPRQLESMIRLSESIAKMRLSSEITRSDVEEAVRLIRTAIQQSATNPKTGEIDMDIINTGTSQTSAQRIKLICDFIRTRVYGDYKDKVTHAGVKYHNLFDWLSSKARDGTLDPASNTISENEFREALNVMEEEGFINLMGHKKAPTIRFQKETE